MKKNIYKVILLAFGFYLFQGCTDLTLRIPTSRMESPESNGKLWRVGLGGGIASDHDVILVTDASARPPVTNQTTIQTNVQSLFFANIGLAQFIDLELRPTLPGTQLIAKFQFLGDSARESQAGNFSIAATVAVGAGNVSNSGNQDVLFGPGNAGWNATASYTAFDFGLVFGYRISDYVLLYGGPYLTRYNAKASIHQDAVTNPSYPAGDYTITGNGTQSGANFASQFTFSKEKHWSITAELVYSNIKWTNASNGSDLTGAADFGYLF